MFTDELQRLQHNRLKYGNYIRQLAATYGSNAATWPAAARQQLVRVQTVYDQTMQAIQAVQLRAGQDARAQRLATLIDQQAYDRSTEVGEMRAWRTGQPTEQQRCLAMQAWLRAGVGEDLSPRHLEACHVTGIKPQRKYLDVNFRPMYMADGLGMWESGRRSLKPPWEEIREQRDMSVGTDSAGGYTVPEGFSDALEINLLAYGGPRKVCRIWTTETGQLIPWPTMDDTSNTGELLSEAGSIGSSTDPSFGEVQYSAYKYSSKPIKFSAELEEDSAFALAQILGSACGTRIGRITSAHYTTGDGSGKPTGLTVAATSGHTAASATAIAASELIELTDDLDPAYEEGEDCGFMFRKSTKTAVRLLTDSNGQFLWQPGLRAGDPDLFAWQPVLREPANAGDRHRQQKCALRCVCQVCDS